MRTISIIPVESPTQNPVLIRMNCLALACLDGRIGDKISLAEDYEYWIFFGKKRYIEAKVAESPHGKSEIEKSGEVRS